MNRLPTASIAVLLLFSAAGRTSALDETTSGDASRRSSLPHWIWQAGHPGDGSSVVLARGFDLDVRSPDAKLRLAAEFCRCTVTFNGNKLLRLDAFAPWTEVDVTEHLRAGANTIELRCYPSEGPSAVAAELQIRTVADDSQTILTDASWIAVNAEDVPGPPSHSAADTMSAALSTGQVAPHLWNTWQSASRITPFDDYEQWRQASGGAASAAPATFAVHPGFEIELLRSAADGEGSWVSLAFDPKGRLTVAREDQGLLRFTLDGDGQVAQVETINDALEECRGLLYAYDSLYVNANNSKGMYRLRDTSGDDQFDEVRLLREFPGGVGHGRNDLALGPDGLIYSIHGDAVQLPQENITDHTSPLRESRRSSPLPEGHLIRTDRDGSTWELVAAGMRNPFGIDFNADGELFTYDADAEFDMGAPWYRPTRLLHLVSGADFGWRGLTHNWPPYRLDRPDHALPVIDVGKGSPTAVKSGRHSSFPQPYRNAMFILDWAYGRIVMCHTYSRGAGYYSRTETFLKGRPLNVTDLGFGPDGAMYFVTGGRKTESSLYRVRYTGAEVRKSFPTEHQIRRDDFGRQQRSLRTAFAQFHGPTLEGTLYSPASYLNSPDPALRQAAHVGLEHISIGKWLPQAMQLLVSDHAEDPVTLLGTMQAMSRTGDVAAAKAVLLKLSQMGGRLQSSGMSGCDRLTALQAIESCVATCLKQSGESPEATVLQLEQWLEKLDSVAEVSPAGIGPALQLKLLTILADLKSPRLVALCLPVLRAASTQEVRMHCLFVMRNATEGWTLEGRRYFFEQLRELDRDAIGGDGMPGFLKRIRDEAIATLSDTEHAALGDLVQPMGESAAEALTTDRVHVRDWTIEDIEELLAASESTVSAADGAGLFKAALCSHCHRFGNSGRAVGPDLSSVGSRFSRRDILTSVLEPSRVIAEKYRGVQVLTVDGRTATGRVLEGGDYRSSVLRIATDPLDPAKVVEIAKADVEEYQPSTVSLMPKGLMRTLNKSEIAALIAYLRTGVSQ